MTRDNGTRAPPGPARLTVAGLYAAATVLNVTGRAVAAVGPRRARSYFSGKNKLDRTHVPVLNRDLPVNGGQCYEDCDGLRASGLLLSATGMQAGFPLSATGMQWSSYGDS